MIEKIFVGEIIVAIIIRSTYKQNGIQFFTEPSSSIQLAYMNRSKGYKIGAHFHPDHEKIIYETIEVLFIKNGKVKVLIFNPAGEILIQFVLNTGDTSLLFAYGHGFEMLEESEIIEVKQGPFSSNSDKRFL